VSEIKHIGKATDEIIDYIDKKRKGEIRELRTRWAKINKNMPIEWNSLYTIAGISGSGKSSFANELETSLFDYNQKEDFAVLSFNYEMLSSRQVGRKLSFKTSKTVSELYSKDSQSLNDEDFAAVKEHANRIRNYDIYYKEEPCTVEEMRVLILKTYEKLGKPLIIFVDHARLVKRGNQSEQDMISDLIMMCMQMKKQIKCSIFVLSQLNREIEKPDRVQSPQGHYPMRSDLFGSDAIFQGSDYVLVIHRPELLSIFLYGVEKLPTKDMVYAHLIKSRDGELKIMSFKNVLRFNRLDEI